MKLSRRSVCAAYDLKAGRKLKNEDLICLRPKGVEPKFEKKKILGKKLLKNIKAGNKIIKEFCRVNMCGIAGYFGFDVLNNSNIEKCLTLMKQREDQILILPLDIGIKMENLHTSYIQDLQ